MFKSHFTHAKILFFDALQKYGTKPIAFVLYFLGRLWPDHPRGLRWIMKSHRLYPFARTTQYVKAQLSDICANAEDLFDGEDSASEAIQKSRGLALKEPRLNDHGQCVEKGVWLITFTGTLQYYIRKVDVRALQERYWIVLEPSWAGYCLSEILWWSQLDDPVFIQATEARDYDFLLAVSPQLIPLPFGASDWVNPDVFHPIPHTTKIYDSIYVSNYNPIKRNHVYLRALYQLRDREFRAALVCGGWGTTRDYNLWLIERLGLANRVEVIESQPQSALNILLNRSKVNVLVSLKEGSNRSLFEGFAAGTPAILLKNNIGVNKTYINDATGRLIEEKQLAETLWWFKHHWQDFSASEWSGQHISIFRTKEKLDNVLRDFCHQRGLPWTYGTQLKINAPEAQLYVPASP